MDRYTQESTHGRTKRHQRQLAEFEALQAEGNPNDCHTQKQSERSSQQRQTPAENQQPKNICKESADGRAAEHDFLPEREKRQSGKLKALQPEWYADDRDAEEQPAQEPRDGQHQPCNQEPEDVSQDPHKRLRRSPLNNRPRHARSADRADLHP